MILQNTHVWGQVTVSRAVLVVNAVRKCNTYGCPGTPGRTGRAWGCCSLSGRPSVTSSPPRI